MWDLNQTTWLLRREKASQEVSVISHLKHSKASLRRKLHCDSSLTARWACDGQETMMPYPIPGWILPERAKIDEQRRSTIGLRPLARSLTSLTRPLPASTLVEYDGGTGTSSCQLYPPLRVAGRVFANIRSHPNGPVKGEGAVDTLLCALYQRPDWESRTSCARGRIASRGSQRDDESHRSVKLRTDGTIQDHSIMLSLNDAVIFRGLQWLRTDRFAC
jgi:hypothetical protein